MAVVGVGGGTFDISILEVGCNVVEVKPTNGNTHLGGDNIDQRIIEWIVAEFRKDQGIDLSKDRTALQRLKEVAEKAKIELSSVMETEISLPFITADATGPKHLPLKLTRSRMEQMIQDILDRTLKPCELAIQDAGISVDKIDEVVLVGGSTRMPKVIQMVKSFFRRDPHQGVNPDAVVAAGAAPPRGGGRGRSRETTGPWGGATSRGFPRRPAASPRSRCLSISTPTASFTSTRRTR